MYVFFFIFFSEARVGRELGVMGCVRFWGWGARGQGDEGGVVYL